MATIIKIPKTIHAAMDALDRMLADLKKASTYQDIKKIMFKAEALKALFREIDDVRLRAGKVIVLSSHRIGLELLKAPPATGTRGQLTLAGPGRGKKGKTGGNMKLPPVSDQATLAELAGYKMKAHRLKKLAEYDPQEAQNKIMELVDDLIRQRVDNITVGATLKVAAGIETQNRRAQSRTAKPIPDGMELRIGDCRQVLADVADNSVPLILTDPPYGDEAEPLYRWLAEFAARVLIPGGSLICYTGQSRLDRDMAILSAQLRYWWLLIMLHDQSQRLPGKFVIANFKPVLWYVKDHRRGRSLVPDILKSPARDKTLHNWSQGDGGISSLIEHLSDPGELIVDPFAGTAAWGRRTIEMGRRWLGADITQGGSENIQAAE